MNPEKQKQILLDRLSYKIAVLKSDLTRAEAAIKEGGMLNTCGIVQNQGNQIDAICAQLGTIEDLGVRDE